MKRITFIILILLSSVFLCCFGYNKYNLNKSLKSFNDREYAKSEAYFENIFLHSILSSQDYLTFGRVKNNLQKYTEALSLFQLSQEKLKDSSSDPNNDMRNKIFFERIVAYYNLNDYRNARKCYDALLESTDDYILIQAASSYGIQSYLSLKDYNAAITLIQSFLDNIDNYLDGFDIHLKSTLIVCYTRTEQHDKALALADELIELDPTNLDFRLDKMFVYNDIHGYDYAMEYLDSIKDQFPGNERLNSLLEDYKEK